jgi:hypothetical protein
MTHLVFLGGPHYPRIARARRLNKHSRFERKARNELPEPEESDIPAIRKIMERAERRYE